MVQRINIVIVGFLKPPSAEPRTSEESGFISLGCSKCREQSPLFSSQYWMLSVPSTQFCCPRLERNEGGVFWDRLIFVRLIIYMLQSDVNVTVFGDRVLRRWFSITRHGRGEFLNPPQSHKREKPRDAEKRQLKAEQKGCPLQSLKRGVRRSLLCLHLGLGHLQSQELYFAVLLW